MRIFITLLFSMVCSLLLHAQQAFPTDSILLPAGKTICITYEVAVDMGDCDGELSNQATVTGSNFSAVLSDDPDQGGASDPTTTMAAALALDTVVYVDSAATGANDGSSWANAFTDLQDALAVCSVDTIFVAEGTYFPDEFGGNPGTGNRDTSFNIPESVVLLGGYPNGGGMRDFEINETILSGDIGMPGNNADNSYHVVRTTGVSAATIMDGFIVTEANADGALLDKNGGGMYNTMNSSPTVINTVFTNNYANNGAAVYSMGGQPSFTNSSFIENTADNGGGMFNESASPTLQQVLFESNTAIDLGGGMYNEESDPSIANAIFRGNVADQSGGGGIYNEQSNPDITNALFSGNEAEDGGAMLNLFSSPIITNSTFSGNKANNLGGALVNSSNSNAIISNSIIWNNRANGMTNTTNASVVNSSMSTPKISHSLIANAIDGSGNWETAIGDSIANNKDVDPQFIMPIDPGMAPSTAGNYRLLPSSPTINMGSNDSINATGVMVDLDSMTRIQQSIVDMGAYEQLDCVGAGLNVSTFYVDSTATGLGTGLSWTDAFTSLQDALTYACEYDTILVAEGTYFPNIFNNGMDTTLSGSGGRDISFDIPDSVVLLGGYPNGGGMRDFENNETILSGDIGMQSINTDNSYHVVRTTGVSATTQMDGFTVTGGNADGSSPDNFGGGMLNENSSLISITNCSFSGNTASSGGGMYNDESSPSITNCSFSGNTSDFNGGGMLNVSSSPSITNCSFSGNSANTGGGMYNTSSSPSITNCSFSGNTANAFGGGMYNTSSSPSITNCSFSGNTAIFGGGMYNDDNSSPSITNCSFSGNSAIFGGGMYNTSSSPSITNCSFSGNTANFNGGGIRNIDNSSPHIANTIIWNNSVSGVTSSTSASIANSSSNPIISYSLIANSGGSGAWNTAIGQDNGDNKDIDPQFITPISPPMLTTAGNLRLRSYSPAINMGSNDSIPPGVTTDLDGEMRIQQSIVDMGAYEQPGITCPSSDTSVVCGDPTDTTALGSVQDLVIISPDSFFVQSDSSGFDGLCDNDTIGRINRLFVIADTSNGDRDTICSQRIAVIDTAAPLITFCPDSIELNIGDATDVGTLGAAIADDCNLDSIAILNDSIGFVNGSPLGSILRTFIAVDFCGRADTCTQLIDIQGIQPRIRMFLSGPLGLGNTTNTLMWDSLRSKGFIPLVEPYTALPGFTQLPPGGGETINDPGTTLSDMGPNSIVDWVFVELRSKANPAIVQATRAALVQRDGDVVDTNGMEGVYFDTINLLLNTDSFYIAVRHRNHLGVMTATPRDLTQSDTIDFTDVSGDFYSQGFAPQDSIHSPNVFALWPGDADGDTQVQVSSDEQAVRQKVSSAPQNTLKLLNYLKMMYESEDVNLDGSVIYAGQENEIDVILDAIYRHPQNGMQSPGFVVPEQLPSP